MMAQRQGHYLFLSANKRLTTTFNSRAFEGCAPRGQEANDSPLFTKVTLSVCGALLPFFVLFYFVECSATSVLSFHDKWWQMLHRSWISGKRTESRSDQGAMLKNKALPRTRSSTSPVLQLKTQTSFFLWVLTEEKKLQHITEKKQ
jgi:hypothetical protein